MTTASKPNDAYNLAQPNSLPVRIALQARRRMYERFLENTGIRPGETLLDVGVTSADEYESSNYLEAWYPYKEKITAVGLDDASFLEQRYPGMRFIQADGKNLPLPAQSFDVVHSSAVLEHVGSASDQRAFIDELRRVARRAVFLTTPNRWFPVEFHTVLPLVHWLPKKVFRGLLRKSARYEFFSREENLNLLSRGDVAALCADMPGWTVSIDFLRLVGLPSNLLVTLTKGAAG
jgi:ubiquinone/menaquinone biosynthesis C-methylase UbiE